MNNKKIALLRGINVGGNRKILMADLKSVLSKNGFINIVTYIQSGNVIFDFESDLSNLKIDELIENIIKKEFGYEVPVITLNFDELEQIIKNNPYSKTATEKQMYFTFLNQKPSNDNLDRINQLEFKPDDFTIIDKCVYLYIDGEKAHLSKMTNQLFEKHLKVKATTRNWKTTLKLVELANV